MIGAGFVCFLVTLSWTSSDVSYTVGQALDKLPAVVFLHVFLAFPTGRLSGRFERALVASRLRDRHLGSSSSGWRSAITAPHNLLAFATEPGAFEVARDVQLLALSACCLAGVAILVARGAGARAARCAARSRC